MTPPEDVRGLNIRLFCAIDMENVDFERPETSEIFQLFLKIWLKFFGDNVIKSGFMGKL